MNITIRDQELFREALSGENIDSSPVARGEKLHQEMSDFLDWLLKEGERTDFGKNALQVIRRLWLNKNPSFAGPSVNIGLRTV